MAAPDVTVVIAAYGRSNVLRHTLDALRRQTHENWEALVVDDASPDDTSALVERVGDSRLRAVRLPRNVGEQSGPNNVGAYLAAAPLLAFLNQDDLWFPDHLAHLLALKESTGARLVYSVIAMGYPPEEEDDDAGAGFRLRSWRSRYDPRFDCPASSWLLDRSLHLELGGWKPSGRCYGPSSQEFLFRAWRAGTTIVASPRLTVLAEGSANRPGSYADRQDEWQRRVVPRLLDDTEGFRREILRRATPVDAEYPAEDALGRVAQAVGRVAERAMARVGISPYEMRFRRQGHGRGDYLRTLRRLRGID